MGRRIHDWVQLKQEFISIDPLQTVAGFLAERGINPNSGTARQATSGWNKERQECSKDAAAIARNKWVESKAERTLTMNVQHARASEGLFYEISSVINQGGLVPRDILTIAQALRICQQVERLAHGVDSGGEEQPERSPALTNTGLRDFIDRAHKMRKNSAGS